MQTEKNKSLKGGRGLRMDVSQEGKNLISRGGSRGCIVFRPKNKNPQ
jgi:hypothetical protein